MLSGVYVIADSLVLELDMCSKPVFCEYFTQKLLLRKTKYCLRLLELQKVAQKLPTTIGTGLLPLPHTPLPPEKLDFSLIGTILDDLGVGGKGRALFFFAKRGKFLFARNYSIKGHFYFLYFYILENKSLRF